MNERLDWLSGQWLPDCTNLPHMIEAASNHGWDMLREGQLTVKDNSQAGDLSGNWKWCSFKVDSVMLKLSHLLPRSQTYELSERSVSSTTQWSSGVSASILVWLLTADILNICCECHTTFAYNAEFYCHISWCPALKYLLFCVVHMIIFSRFVITMLGKNRQWVKTFISYLQPGKPLMYFWKFSCNS